MLQQKELERRKAANLRALETMNEKPAIKVIDLLRILVEISPNLPVVVNVEGRELSIISVLVGGENNVRLQAQDDHGQDRGSAAGRTRRNAGQLCLKKNK